MYLCSTSRMEAVMVDKSVGELLESWGVGHLLNVFEENQIDKAALELLDEASIQELIPKIGTRLKFLRGWRSEFKVVEASDCFSLDMDDIFNDTSPSCSSLGSSSQTVTPPRKKRRISSLDARCILENSACGTDIIKRLEKQKVLNKRDRCKMTSLLVGHLMDHHGLKPSAYEKETLATSIIEEFPYLKDAEGKGYEAWFMKGAKHRPATGYLEERLRYVRKAMLKQNKTDTSESNEDSCPDETRSMNCDDDDDDEEDVQQMISWLQENQEPKEKIAEFMSKTAEKRKHFIHEEQATLCDILKEFPRILDKGMLEQDFKLAYHPKTADSLIRNWEELSEAIITYASVMNSLWKQHLGLPDVDLKVLSSVEKNNLALLVLPVLLGGRAKGKSGGRCALAQSLTSFIHLKPATTNIEQYLGNISEKDKPQPYILGLFTGNKLLPSQTFVVIERRAVESSSLLDAVDIAFKAHYVLNLSYQVSVKAVWEFLQCVVYNLPGTARPAVRDIRAFLMNHTKNSAQK